ncbi:hypothetical protein PybrP1_010896 [[Pythium] brassicae (nom. inval.)]|nr:hypothetical protein PybrP1_010896 [[Pythium] brassicae (nom. inval.)]
MSAETPALPVLGRKASALLLLPPADAARAFEDRVEAERAVFAKCASIRKLSTAPILAFDPTIDPSNQEPVSTGSLQAPLLAAVTPAGGLQRRPSTAASAHSRVHQALRRSESEFTFSSKDTTVDGFLYSSRFEHRLGAGPGHSRKNRPATSSPLDPRIRQKLAKVGKNAREAAQSGEATSPSIGSGATTVDAFDGSSGTGACSVAECDDSLATSLQQRRRRAISQDVASPLLVLDTNAATSATWHAQQMHAAEERALLQRKRRCAKTFEEMILARLIEATSADALAQSMAVLLSHGIVQSVLDLSSIADAATQAHCSRALYYLSKAPAARKSMVAHGVVSAIKALSRIAAPRPRQDLAATLCHLSEESGLVEVLLFEGIDQSLARMFATPSAETKRICALTVFNISVDALSIKHFGDVFVQLLVLSTRASSSTAASNLIKAAYNASLAPAFHAALLSENIPRFLLHQLPHVSAHMQALVLRALVALCDSKPNRAQILSPALCKLLESMLKLPDEAIQEATLTILLLLSTDDGSRIKLCNWVPAAAIVQNAGRHVDTCAEKTELNTGTLQENRRLVYLQSCVLRNLCDSVLTHHELVEEGVVRVLLEMSRMDDGGIKTNAICALCCIISSSSEESADYVLEITSELLALTHSESPKTVEFAIGALYNVACSDESLRLLAENPRLLPRILQLAGSADAPPLQALSERVAELVAAILYRLASVRGHHKEMLAHAVLPVLVGLIHRFPSGRTFAVNALYLLAQDGGDHFPHGSDEVTRLAIALSEDSASGTGASATSAAESSRPTLRSAVTLLAHLARDPKNQRALVRSDAVFRFLRRLKRLEDEETILINCAFVYFGLAATQEGCEQLVREQGIEDVIYLSRANRLTTASNQVVKEHCMFTLCRLSSFIGLEARLIEHGAIEAVMIMALVATDSALIKELCVKTLANCLVARNCVRPLIDHGVIWALSSLCLVDLPETRYACAVSLCNLSAVTNLLSRFLDAGAPRALIHLLKHSDSAATTMATVKAIANLVANEKICAVFLNEELEKHLSARFSDPASGDELRQLAAMVLLRVTSANDALISFERLKHGVFVWMEQIIVMKEPALVRNCMLTVHDLTCNTTIDAAELDVDHILRIVVQVFARHQHADEIVTLCLSIVYNLSCQRYMLPRLVAPEIMTILQCHIPAGALDMGTNGDGVALDDKTNEHPASSASATASAPAAAMPGVSSSTATNTRFCCLVLHNMSCHLPSPTTTGGPPISSPDDLLASLVNFHAVAMLFAIYASRDDLKEICAIATGNIVVGKVNSSRVLDDHAGDLLLHFVLSSFFHASHYLLVSAALRKLVNAPGNQQQLLAAGATKAVVFMLELADIGAESSMNLLAALALLSKCTAHLSRLLDDGVLPCVVRIAETKSPAPSSDVLALCFEILSNVCTVNFEAHLHCHPGINVVSTLTHLSEHPFCSNLATSCSTPSSASSSRHQRALATATPKSPPANHYAARGDGAPLGTPPLLTFLLKSPSSASSLKKNLELTATYTVAARKWVPEARPTPKDPPPLVCAEVPLTETSQSVPLDVRQRVRSLLPLPKDLLVRDECADDKAAASASSSRQLGPLIAISGVAIQ